MPHAPSPPTDLPALVLAHGFTQNAGCWGPFGDELATRRPVHPVDLPGHGTAPPASGLAEAAERLGAAGGRAPYLGYSMGGRVGLHLALARPDLVMALVLIGAHPGITDPHERARRREADGQRADHLAAVGLDAFLDEWLAQPLFAGLGPEADQRAQRRANDPAGLAATLRTLGTGHQDPLWDRLPTLTMPVLYVAGAEDAAYVAVGRRVVDTIGSTARLALVPDAGHAAHLQEPQVTATLVTDFLEKSNV